jgi:hypothetical protein
MPPVSRWSNVERVDVFSSWEEMELGVMRWRKASAPGPEK